MTKRHNQTRGWTNGKSLRVNNTKVASEVKILSTKTIKMISGRDNIRELQSSLLRPATNLIYPVPDCWCWTPLTSPAPPCSSSCCSDWSVWGLRTEITIEKLTRLYQLTCGYYPRCWSDSVISSLADRISPWRQIYFISLLSPLSPVENIVHTPSLAAEYSILILQAVYLTDIMVTRISKYFTDLSITNTFSIATFKEFFSFSNSFVRGVRRGNIFKISIFLASADKPRNSWNFIASFLLLLSAW